MRVETFGLIGTMVIPLLASPLLYEGERVGVLQWCGTACVLAATVVLSFNHKKESGSSNENRKKTDITELFLLLCLVLSNAGVSITQKLFVEKVGAAYLTFFNLLTFGTCGLCFALVLLFKSACQRKKHADKTVHNSFYIDKKSLLLIVIAALAIYGYQYFGSIASADLGSAIYYPLVCGVSVVLTTLSDTLIFKQKFTRYTLVALIFVFFAIVSTNV